MKLDTPLMQNLWDKSDLFFDEESAMQQLNHIIIITPGFLLSSTPQVDTNSYILRRSLVESRRARYVLWQCLSLFPPSAVLLTLKVAR